MLIRCFVFIFVLNSCGTLQGTSKVTSVDSKPRGVSFIAPNDPATRQHTPVLLSIEQDSALKFKVFSEIDSLTTQEISCSTRWLSSVTANVAVSGLGLVAGLPLLAVGGGIGLVWDHASGGMFECPSRITLVGVPQSQSLANPVVAIILPDWFEESLEHQLLSKLHKIVSDELPYSDFVQVTKVRKALARQGFNPTLQFSRSDLSERHLLDLAHELNATHLVFVAVEEGPDLLGSTADILDVHAKGGAVPKVVEVSLPRGRDLEYFGTKWSKFLSFRFFPNSVLYGYSSRLREIETPSNGYIVKSSKDRSILPKFLSRFGFMSVTSSRAFQPWDFILNIGTTITGSYGDRRLRIMPHEFLARQDVPIEEQELEVDVKFLSATPLLVIGPDLHTPLGRFGIHGVAGPRITYVKTSLGDEYAKFSGAYGIEGDYLAFITSRVFTNLLFRVLRLRPPALETQFVRELDISADFSASVGVLF